MIITRIGRDLISVCEETYIENKNEVKDKIHLIELNFENPTEEKMDNVLSKYYLTNRFIINNNISFYNWYFKNNLKKYYVENTEFSKIFSFFRKNNKVLLNFDKLNSHTKNFLLRNDIFTDILKNLEIIKINESIFSEKNDILKKWNGNVVIL